MTIHKLETCWTGVGTKLLRRQLFTKVVGNAGDLKQRRKWGHRKPVPSQNVSDKNSLVLMTYPVRPIATTYQYLHHLHRLATY